MFDCTPDFRQQLHALGGPPLHGIFLTHAHMGHYTGLLHLGPEAWARSGVLLYVMPGMRSFLQAHAPWCELLEGNHVSLVDLHHEEAVPLGAELRVTPFLVPHRGPWTETVGFRIEGPRRTVLFVPDIDRWEDWTPDLPSILAKVDVAYVDGSFFTLDELGHRPADRTKILHPPVRHTMDLLQDQPASLRERVRFLHLNHTNPLLRPGSDAWREVHDRGFRVAVTGEALEL